MATNKPLIFTDILYIEDLPRDCIEECAASGQCLPAVQRWIKRLDFKIKNREDVTQGLLSYGAWEDDQLADMTDEELAEKILWIACGDFNSYIIECERRGIDPYDGESHDVSDGSDCFCLS